MTTTATLTPAQKKLHEALLDGGTLAYRPNWDRGSMRMLWTIHYPNGTTRTLNANTCWALMSAGALRELRRGSATFTAR